MFTLREIVLEESRESQKCQADINNGIVNGSVFQLYQ